MLQKAQKPLLYLSRRHETCTPKYRNMHVYARKWYIYTIQIYMYTDLHKYIHTTPERSIWPLLTCPAPSLNTPPFTLGYSLSCTWTLLLTPCPLLPNSYLSGKFQPRISSSGKPFRISQDQVRCLFQKVSRHICWSMAPSNDENVLSTVPRRGTMQPHEPAPICWLVTGQGVDTWARCS